jgi:hypothetical protein
VTTDYGDVEPDDTLLEVLHLWPEDLSGRFQEWFAETYTVVKVARLTYGQPPPSVAETVGFLGYSTALVPCWKHP